MATILCVDDDPAIARLVGLVLRSEGFTVHSAYSGEEALVLLDQQSAWPDLVVLDLAMPGMGGKEFFHAARCCGYNGPVVICSAYGARAACDELGAQAAVTKPFDPFALLATISQLVPA